MAWKKMARKIWLTLIIKYQYFNLIKSLKYSVEFAFNNLVDTQTTSLLIFSLFSLHSQYSNQKVHVMYD